jgi:hypothetical protein
VLSSPLPLSLTASFSYSAAIGRVFRSKNFYVWEGKDRVVQSMGLTAASSLNERSQLFVQSALVKGKYSEEGQSQERQNLSDTQLGYTYEVLPEYSFSYWRPVLFLSLLVNLPTGHSIYDKESLTEGAAVTGHNQWGTGLGITLRKVYFPLTITLQGKWNHVYARSFEQTYVSDFIETSISFLANYVTSFYDVAMNVGITQNYLSPRKLQPSGLRSQSMRNSSLMIGAQKVLSENWGTGINYVDQTLIGQPKNSLLNRSVSVFFNYNKL